jgi:uncharacterized protein YbjT (DUF2867 family)
MNKDELIMVTGASGYVGSRLVAQLLSAGYKVRAGGRSLRKLQSKSWAQHSRVELVSFNVLNREALTKAMQGCSVVYYMVHSMNPESRDFARTDRVAAKNMVAATQQAGVKQIIYLGGLGEETDALSKHLRSRAEVADILRSGSVPVTVLRAAMIIGAGSASFEIMRYLTERLPLMITPRWVSTPSQPIAIRNVLNYLVGCLEHEQCKGNTYDIGGSEVVTYRDLIETYAEEASLKKRIIIPIPFFAPKLSSYWIHLVTPVPAHIARPLADGLRNPAICQNTEIQTIIPQRLLNCREAIRLAREELQHHRVDSHWTDAGGLPPPEWCSDNDPLWAGGTVLQEEREMTVRTDAAHLWKPIVCIGGSNGWYHADWLWEMRGWLDRLIGGSGLRRGRRDPDSLAVGDALDFWRVLDVRAEKRLLLSAEMKLPGVALMDFRLNESSDGTVRLTHTLKFLPNGLFGIVYWYAVSPMHSLVFSGMLKGIASKAGAQIISGPWKRRASSPSELNAAFGEPGLQAPT